MRHIQLVSGNDSLTTAIVQKTRCPDLLYEYVFNDTYAELPEVQVWLDKAELYLGAPIIRIGENLEDVIMDQGVLPGHGPIGRFCTRIAKIEPLETFIGTSEATVYYGLRADEPDRVGYKENGKHAIHASYPLRELGMTKPLVWHMLQQLDLLAPQFFWQDVYDRVLDRLGPIARDFIENLLPWERAMLFSWRTRPNCYYCYFQRKYEWIGLLCIHPDLYWHAAEIEENVGKDNGKKQRVKMYTWRQGESLRELALQKDEVIDKRVSTICKAIIKKAQGGLFVDEEQGDELGLTSCGLYCGK